MTYDKNTTIKGPSRGSAGAIYQWALKQGCDRPADVLSYLTTMYKLCTTNNIGAEVLIAQSIHETTDIDTGAPWASYWWAQRCNPAGIGITGDTAQNNASRDFKTGDAAARAHFLHDYLYAVGASIPSGVSKSDDPRYDAAISAGYAGIAPTLSGFTNRYGIDDNYANAWVGRLNALDTAGLLTDASSVPTPSKETPVSDTVDAVIDKLVDIVPGKEITFGKVPKFGYIDRQSQTTDKPEGVGWDNLGKRNPKAVVLHRMVGSLTGTDSWFGSPSVGSLTDFGIGIRAQDGANYSKVIMQWNDPYGYRAGWASGPVNGAYGDGLAIVNKYGINAVNRDCISIEISGQYNTAIADDEFEEIAKFLAYFWDQMHVPYDKAPVNPATGISAVLFHQEYTLGTGKICPGPVVMNAIDNLITRAVAIMKPYQTGTTTGATSTPPVVTVPEPTWSDPKPIAELAKYTKADADSAPAGLDTPVGRAVWVDDDIVAIRDTFRRQEPSKNAKYVGPTLKKDQQAHGLWLITKSGGEEWYYSDYYTFFLAADFKRVKD